MATRPAASPASELIVKGRESAAVLRDLLCQQPAAAGEMPQGIRDLTEQILRCCDRALAALQGDTEDAASGAGGRKRKPEHGTEAPPRSKMMRVSGREKGIRVEKKWTMEDGYIWRKYGQKEIRDSKYPRLYFRCTCKDDQGCKASRRVQQSDADPSIYLITYFGEHTCRNEDGEPPAPLVIDFGANNTTDGQPNGSPWPSCDDNDDGLLAVSEASEICVFSEGENQQPVKVNASELSENSTPVPVPEMKGMMSQPGWEETLDWCLDWELGDGDISFDFSELINVDYLGLLHYHEF